MLRISLEMEDFVFVTMHVDEVRRGRATLVDFVREHDPAVIIYDVVPPYDHSWRVLEYRCGWNTAMTRRCPSRAAESVAAISVG